MQLRHIKTIRDPGEMVEGKFQKITAIDWSPSGMRLAVATVDRYIILYDSNGEMKDKFSTKPGNKAGPRNYSIRSLSFSPDSTKLAVAQSDNIVFIYKLGSEWGDKKTICNKFTQTSSVTCLCWPRNNTALANSRNELVFGLADGKMRIGILRNNKSATLYYTETPVVSTAPSPDGGSFVSGHYNGAIFKYSFPDQAGPIQGLLAQVQFVPYCLGWGEHIVAAGNTGVVVFFDANGRQVQQIDYSGDEAVKEFSSIAFNPSGTTVVLGNFDRFYTFVHNPARNKWDQTAVTVVENLYTVTALTWKNDGSRLSTGSLCGAVDIYDACIRRCIYRNKFEFTYTSVSSVIVKRMATGLSCGVQSRFRCEIQKINIYSDRFLVAHTPDTLIMADLQTSKQSEIPWNGSGKEKFFFDNENACMVFNAGELSLVEYGRDEVLGSLRTEYMSPHLISLRLGEARNESEKVAKKIAFLLDNQAVRVMDLVSSVSEATYSHDCKIDWLELNQRGTKLLFRDKRRALHLYDIASQERITMLNFCNYVQWVPDSDVVVAQNRRQLCVWYSIDNPTDCTTIPIKGDVEDIERTAGRTEVIVDEGMATTPYKLDEHLITFGSAMDGRDYKRAIDLLEASPPGDNSVEPMWVQLSELAIADNNFVVAERCFAALGDVSRTQYLREVNRTIGDSGGNVHHYLVKTQLFVMAKQFKRAEAELLQAGAVEEAIQMYRKLHKWEEAVEVAQSKAHPSANSLRQEYYEYLINTKQEEVAGGLKEKEGDYSTAVQLYLKGGFPTRAADLVVRYDMSHDNSLCERVADALVRSKQFEKAGEFLEALRLYKRALECYVRGHAFFRAVELARMQFPSKVVELESDWGDWLAHQKQMDAASNHYIQAGAYLKAINAAVEARQWAKAVQILDQIDNSTAKPYYKRIAQHYAETKRYAEAERYFIQGGLPQEAVQMYTTANEWDKAHKIAITYMPSDEVGMLYVTQAQLMESQGKFKDAERLYLTVDEPDLAISMYKKNRQYEDMIRLVASHRKELLSETHIHLASQFQSEGNFKLAEKHYISAKEWKPCVSMYRENEMWEECLRVAQQHGGPNAYKQVAYAFAVSVGGDAGVKLLAKRGLGEQAVDYAIERSEFTEAFHIAEKSCKHKLPEVHLQYAMALEDEGRFERAEEEFLKAKKPKEAINMYIYQQDWDAGMRVAEQYEPAAIADVQEAKGKHLATQQNYQGAELLFIQAKKPDQAIKMYQDADMWDDALRLAKKFLPRAVPDIQAERMQHMGADPVSSESSDFLIQQAQLFESQKNFNEAIDTYLKLSKSNMRDLNRLAQLWDSAVSLAMEYVKPRANEVVNTVGKRLKEIGKHEEAAEMYMGSDNFKEAIDTFIQVQKFDKARACAESATDSRSWMQYVDKAYQDHLIRSDQMAELGDVNPDAAIEMFVNRGDWNQVYALAGQQGEAAVVKFASIHAKKLVGEAKYKAALQVLTEHGVSAIPANFGLYKRIAQEVLAFSENDQITKSNDAEVPPEVRQLRHMLFKLCSDLKEIDPDGPNTHAFDRLLLVAHLYCRKVECASLGLHKIEAKLATSLLRYTDTIPVDKAFYEAGFSCIKAGNNNMAFVFLNRYIDLSDLIDEPDDVGMDNSDFLETDIPLTGVPLPHRQSYDENMREEAREWVLDKAMGNEVSQTLGQRNCFKCNRRTYEASLCCHACQARVECCSVTGYPLSKDTHNPKMTCPSCNISANRDDWNMYVQATKQCPWCEASANQNYGGAY